VIDDYLYFVVKHTEEYIKTLPEGTVQQNLNRDVLRSVEIPLPSLAEQQTLQSDFDEIRHKHAKIAEYKAKAQEAIQRLIPGAQASKADKADTAAIATESVTSMSHSSTCEVDEDGYGCTCRLPLEKEDLSTTDSATAIATAAVAIPEVSATAAVSAPPVRRRPTKVAVVE
jgi:hypothetical protein